MNQYVHHVPGRLRVRVPDTKGNLAEANSLEKRIRAQKGVRDVQTNPLTGSVLVYYDPATASVSTLSQMMLRSAPTEPVRRTLPSVPSTNISRRIATRVAAAVIGHVMEMAMERAAVALIAAIL